MASVVGKPTPISPAGQSIRLTAQNGQFFIFYAQKLEDDEAAFSRSPVVRSCAFGTAMGVLTGKWEHHPAARSIQARPRHGRYQLPDDASVPCVCVVIAGGGGVGAQEPGPREDARVRARRACRHAPRRRQHPQVSRAPTQGTPPYGATPHPLFSFRSANCTCSIQLISVPFYINFVKFKMGFLTKSFR